MWTGDLHRKKIPHFFCFLGGFRLRKWVFCCFQLGKNGFRVSCLSLWVFFGPVKLMKFQKYCPFTLGFPYDTAYLVFSSKVRKCLRSTASPLLKFVVSSSYCNFFRNRIHLIIDWLMSYHSFKNYAVFPALDTSESTKIFQNFYILTKIVFNLKVWNHVFPNNRVQSFSPK